jgi:hypothetical protein
MTSPNYQEGHPTVVLKASWFPDKESVLICVENMSH